MTADKTSADVRRTALYRLYDARGDLLYVGIAFEPEDRWAAHSVDKRWWAEVTDKRTAWYPNRVAALAAETEAIKTERPLYNKADSDEPYDGQVLRPDVKQPRIIRVPDESWDAYGEACADAGTTRADDMRRHIHAQVKAWRAEQRRAAAEERSA